MKYKSLIKLFRQKQTSDAKKRLKVLGTDYGCGKIYDLNYMKDDDFYHRCDVYYPAGKKDEKLPVIMEIHGGGFCTGTKIINEGHGLYYASKGYKVVNVNYTLLPEVTYLEEMQELFAALHWIEANADKYGFDLDKLFISGDSGGGFHVLLMAAIQNSKELQEYYHITPVAKGIKGVAATCPCADYRKFSTSKAPVWRLITPLAFQDPRYKDETFIHHISAPDTFRMSDYPRVFISTSKDDNLLYEDSLQAHKLLEELGIDHVYKEYVGRGHKLEHVWNVLWPHWEESMEVNDDFLAYFEEMSQSM